MPEYQPIRTKLKIVNPQVSDSPRTYLTADVDAAATATSLTILSKRGFFKADRNNKDYFFILAGDYNQEKTEIKYITADDTDNKTLAVASLSNSHSAADPITYIDYDQIKIYGATLPGGTKTLLATINIDPTQSFTEYIYEYISGVNPILYSYFITAFFNSKLTLISEYSEEVEGTTFNRRSIKRIIESSAIKALTKIEESPTSILNWSNAVDIVQDGVDEIQVRKRTWPFWRSSYSGIFTQADVAYIEKPTNLAAMEFMKIDGTKVSYISRTKYIQLTGNSDTPSEKGRPVYYTDKNNRFYLIPCPDRQYTVDIDFYATPATLVELSDTVPLAIVPILIYYCSAMFAYIRGNDKRGDKMYAMFIKLLEQQVDEYSGPDQTGDAESIETTNELFFED